MLTTRAGQMAESEVTLSAFYGISSPWAYLGAERMVAIAKKHGVKLIHRPIRVIQANGGIPLRTRPDSRQQYHEVELDRWRKYLDIPLNLKPKFCRFSPGRSFRLDFDMFELMCLNKVHALKAELLYDFDTLLVTSH